MKSEIIIFFVWAVYFNIVASYHHYSGPGYRQEAYQQRPDWSNNQNYAPNQNPAYPLNQPSANNYGPPQPVVNFRRDHPIVPNYEQDENYSGAKQEPIYVPHPQEGILEPRFQQQVVANSQSDDVYAEPQPEPSPQTFSEVSRPYLPEETYPDVPRPYLPERSHESFVAQPSHWQSQPPPPPLPPPPAFVQESYPPQVPRHWQPQNSYPPSLPIQQEPYPQPASYPQWQPAGYKTEPQKNPFYGSAYNEPNHYNSPLQYDANAHAQVASAASADKSQEKPASQKLFLLFHPNGTKAHMDFIERDLPDNSQYLKSINININDANIEEKNLNVRRENLYNKPDSTIPDNKNQMIHLNEPYQNNDFLPEQRPIIVKETNDAVPAKELYVDNVNKPRNDLLKMNNDNYPDSNIAVKPVSDYRPISVFKTNQPQENSFLEHNIAPAQSPFLWNNNKNNNFRKHIDNEPILTTLKDIKDKKYENPDDIKKISESLVPLKEEALKKYSELVISHPVKTNPITNFNLPSTEAEESNNYRNPTLDSLPKIEENYYPSELKYFNIPQVQNKGYDTFGSASEYTDKSVSNYVKNKDSPVPSDDLTTNTFPKDYLIKSKNPDDININPKITPPKKSNYDAFEIKDQTKVSANEPNDGPSSNVKKYPGDANPSTHDYTYDVVNITSLIAQNTDGKNIDIYHTYNTVPQTMLNSTSLQKFETDPNNDDSQPIADSIEGSYTSSITADETKALSPIERERTPKEDFLTNIDVTNTGAEEAENQQPENINSNDEAKTDKESGENGAVIDSASSIAANKPVIMMRSNDSFWDGLYSENEAGAYDGYYFCDVKITDLVIERTSKFYMYENRSFVEETEEVVWEHKDDAVPIEIKTTKIIRNPKAEFSPRIEGSDGAPKCYKPPKI